MENERTCTCNCDRSKDDRYQELSAYIDGMAGVAGASMPILMLSPFTSTTVTTMLSPMTSRSPGLRVSTSMTISLP